MVDEIQIIFLVALFVLNMITIFLSRIHYFGKLLSIFFLGLIIGVVLNFDWQYYTLLSMGLIATFICGLVIGEEQDAKGDKNE